MQINGGTTTSGNNMDKEKAKERRARAMERKVRERKEKEKERRATEKMAPTGTTCLMVLAMLTAGANCNRVLFECLSSTLYVHMWCTQPTSTQ